MAKSFEMITEVSQLLKYSLKKDEENGDSPRFVVFDKSKFSESQIKAMGDFVYATMPWLEVLAFAKSAVSSVGPSAGVLDLASSSAGVSSLFNSDLALLIGSVVGALMLKDPNVGNKEEESKQPLKEAIKEAVKEVMEEEALKKKEMEEEALKKKEMEEET